MRKISIAREVAYLRALADTGDARLAADAAGMSRSRAYKRREVDPGFDALFRENARAGESTAPVRLNRDRAGGWTAAKEARFVERLAETCSVPLAAAEVNLSTVSAYRRRRVRPLFAAAWDEAERNSWPPADQPWIESAVCFFEGREPPPGSPVRITSVAEVLSALAGNRFVPRRPRVRADLADGRDSNPF